MRAAMLGLVLMATFTTAAPPQTSQTRGAEQVPSLDPPGQVSVLPLFLVPAGAAAPTGEQKQALERHLQICRLRYDEMLGMREGFRVAPGEPRVVRSQKSLADLHNLPEDSAPEIVATLLAEYKVNRFTCPYIFVTVVMNAKEDWPAGGGRPLNGGFNTGGGIVILSSRALDASRNFQSTLQHEIGHSFGLPHVDAYGHDMGRSPSLMSYNPKHHTNGFLRGRARQAGARGAAGSCPQPASVPRAHFRSPARRSRGLPACRPGIDPADDHSGPTPLRPGR